MTLVVVTWEPVLHAVSNRLSASTWRLENFNRVAEAQTCCGQHVTGFIDTDERHVVSCLECMVKAR